MGVRFQCPAGHKLHVKAELAGKRGICPECGAKFVVPSFSGGRVAEDNGDGASAAAGVSTPPPVARAAAAAATSAPPARVDEPTDSILIQTSAPADASPAPSPMPPMAQPASGSAPSAVSGANASAATASAPPIAWYVRPAAGGQFGPATTEVFHQWIADGRVAVDSWVWRTGWADWKAGGEALALLAEGLAAVLPQSLPGQASSALGSPAQALAVAIEERTGVLPGVSVAPAVASTTPHVELSTAELRRLEIKRRKQRVRTISTALALVALAMLMALVVVLAR